MCENNKNVVVDDCLCFAINETLNHYKEKGIYPVQLQRGEVEENLNHSFGQWLSYMYTYLPRSAAESEYITMDYLSKEEVKKEFLNSILSFFVKSMPYKHTWQILLSLIL